jgi:signal transduction histidine kinase
MKDLMEEVLLLSRVDSGRMECQPAPIDVASLVRRVVAELEASNERRTRIEIETNPALGAVRLDESLISIILANLLSNAVKYTPDATPVGLLVRHEDGEIIFEVRDRGIGIPQSDQLYLFHSFHRASNVGAIPGTGLGLTIVKRCAELHGGSVSFTSAEGQGTTFTVRLPA